MWRALAAVFCRWSGHVCTSFADGPRREAYTTCWPRSHPTLAAAKVGLVERRGRDPKWLKTVVVRWACRSASPAVVTPACCANGPLDSRWFLVGHAVSLLTAPALRASSLRPAPAADRRAPVAARVLAASGRMALTQYLAQSLVLALVFTGYGLGLYDRVGTAVVLAWCPVCARPTRPGRMAHGAGAVRAQEAGLLEPVTLGGAPVALQVHDVPLLQGQALTRPQASRCACRDGRRLRLRRPARSLRHRAPCTRDAAG
ncbi:hypothetical protein SGRIM119S_06425 [Streptomyces griseorubiginosus]